MLNDQFVQDYLSGETVTTVAMGGMSSGYEMCIQEMGIWMLGWLESNPIDFERVDEDDKYREQMTQKLEEFVDPGCTGAQLGAAKNLALVFHRNGHKKGLELAGEDRWITIQKDVGVLHHGGIRK